MHENAQKWQKLIDLDSNLAIYSAHIDSLREQDKNARVMSGDMFTRLVDNIRKENRLESLPFCAIRPNKAGNMEMQIISGHHRTRAARAAGLSSVYVLVDTRELKHDQVAAKQLAHNAINGRDDEQVKQEIFESIQDLNAKIEAAIDVQKEKFDIKQIKTEDLRLKMDFEALSILFLPHQKEDFEDVINLLTATVGENVYIAEQKLFPKFKKAAQKVSKAEDIRNISSILYKMIEIVRQHYANLEAMQASNEATRQGSNVLAT